jgi:hypothetical protein
MKQPIRELLGIHLIVRVHAHALEYTLASASSGALTVDVRDE